MENNPFPTIVLSDSSFLDMTSTRMKCLKCGKSRKYFCYSCNVPLPHIAQRIPKVKLPVTLDIIKHPKEIDGKSTAPQAAVLAPDDVTIYTYPCIPDYDEKKALLIFPGDKSVTLEKLASDLKQKMSHENSSMSSKNDLNGQCHKQEVGSKRKHSEGLEDKAIVTRKSQKLLPFTKIVFIDSTWNQTHNFIKDERLKGLRRVELKSRPTHFWRCQDGMPKTYLSTIEAIYYFMVDFHKQFINDDYQNEYDDLMFFFSHMYHKIRADSDGGKDLKAYQRS